MNIGDDERQLQTERMMIEEIQKRPFLWDETLPEHKDMEKARQAWEQVGRIFGLSGPKAKSRWKSMRDIYVRYLRKLALKGGGSAPKWKHFEAMSFIADHIKHRRNDLQYTNFGGGVIATNVNAEADKQVPFPHNSDDDEEVNGAGTSKRLTRGRKRKRTLPAGDTSIPQMTSTPRLEAAIETTAVPALINRRSSQNTPGLARTIGTSSSTMMPVLTLPPQTGVSMTSDGISNSNRRHVPQLTTIHQHGQPMAMIGTGLVPVTSIIRTSTSSGINGGSGRSAGQESSSFPSPLDDDADDLFGRAIAATLKKMPARIKALSKLRIQQVLYELEEAPLGAPAPPNAVIYQSPAAGPSNQQSQQQAQAFV